MLGAVNPYRFLVTTRGTAASGIIQLPITAVSNPPLFLATEHEKITHPP